MPQQLLFLCLLFKCVVGAPASNDEKLIVILMDGFRWNYPDIGNMLGFEKMKNEGARAKYLEPIFPSLSYPNYYSIATGRFAESHGFVGNIMYDPNLNEFFKMEPHDNATNSHWWLGAEPIWITATKISRKASLYRWPGCQVEHGDVKPFRCVPYSYLEGVEAFRQDLEQAVSDIQTEGVRLAMVYVEHADKVGHYYGPNSEQSRVAIHELDDALMDFLKGLEAKNLNNKVNIIIVSDHGMLDTSPETTRIIDLGSIIDISDVEFVLDFRAYAGIVPAAGKVDKIYNALKGVQGLDVYRKEEIPGRFYMKDNYRTPELNLVAKPGYYIEGFQDTSKQVPPGPKWDTYNLKYSHNEEMVRGMLSILRTQYSGNHGYDPQSTSDMRGIFYATGPAFKKGYEGSPIKTVDVYNLMADVLRIKPLPNNGTASDVVNFLRDGTFKTISKP